MECFQPIPVTQNVFYVNHWTRQGSEKKSLRITVYPDDTVLRILTKITHAMGKTRLPYAWKSKPLLFTPSGAWMNAGYHVNPWKSSEASKALEEKPKLNFHTQDIVSSNIFATKVLNITFVDDLPEELQNDYYFPDLGIKIPSKTAVEKEDTLLASLWMDEPSTDMVQMGQCIYTNVVFEGTVKTDMMLADMFLQITANKDIPFIQWVDDKTRVLYKVFEQHSIPATMLRLWTDYDRMAYIKEGMLVMYSPFKGGFVKVSVDSNGMIQISYRMDSRDKIKLDVIIAHHEHLTQHLTSTLKAKVAAKMSNISIRTEVYKSDATLKSVGGVISTALPVFHMLNLNSSALDAIYKRSSNYKTIDITETIQGLLKFGNAPVEEVIKRIMNTYGFSLSEATSYVNQATDMENVATNKKVETGVFVQIAPIALGFRVSIDQAPSLEEARCALHWIRSCIHRATAKVAKTAAPVVPQVKPTKAPTPSSSSSSKSASSEKSLSSSLSIGGAIGKEYQGHFLRMLQKADPKIFVDNDNYARMCMVTNYRQPVVMSKSEKEALDKTEYGQGVDNFMEYGSDPKNPNVYFCPRIWCPESRVPMTPEQYEQHKACPKGEAPIKMFEHSYWDNNPNVKHNIGFHSSKGKNGLCLPCCMKREKKPAAFQKELKECASPLHVEEQPAKTKAKAKENVKGKVVVKSKEAVVEVEDEAEPIKEEYYLMTQSAPLPKGRYGTVPKPLHNALYPNISHSLCSKVLTSQECLVRKGIEHGSDSLMSAIANACGMASKAELIKHIKKKLDPITFLALEHGQIVTLFAPEYALVPREHASLKKRWVAWIQHFPKYVSLCQLESIVEKPLADLQDEQMMILSRELSIFDAYERFIAYLTSSESKNPYLLYDVLRHLDVLFLLWEKQDNDNAQLYCPFYTSQEELVDAVAASSKAILLLKDGDVYEPLELKQRNKTGVATIPFTKASPMIDMLHSCKPAQDDPMRPIVASLISYDMWVDRALVLPSQFRIQTLVISPELKIAYGLTKANILIKIPAGGIPMGYLGRIMKDMNIQKIVHQEDIEGTPYTCKFVATDLQLVTMKLTSFGFGMDAGRVISSNAFQGVTMYETLVTIPPSTTFPTVKTMTSIPIGYEAKDRKWHQMQLLVGKTLLGHFETLVQPLQIKIRTVRVRTLMNTFPHIKDRKMLQAVMEEMPLEYGKKALADWLRRVSYLEKYPFLDGHIRKKQHQYIFSQVAVEKGLPRDILVPAKGPRPSSSSPSLEAQEEKELVPPSKILLTSTGLPDGINLAFEKLPSKWTQIKTYEWATFKMGVIADYSDDIMWNLLEWMASQCMMPIKKDELVWMRNRVVNQSLMDPDLMSIYLEDPSFLQHWNAGFAKKYVDGKQLIQKAYVPKMKTQGALSQMWKAIVDKGTLRIGSIDLYVLTKLVQCSILILHRAPYGEGNKKRGDIEDLGISSTFYTKDYTESYVNTKPLFIFYKTYEDSYTRFSPIVDANGTFLHKSVNLSSKDVRDLVSYHIQYKTNKLK